MMMYNIDARFRSLELFLLGLRRQPGITLAGSDLILSHFGCILFADCRSKICACSTIVLHLRRCMTVRTERCGGLTGSSHIS